MTGTSRSALETFYGELSGVIASQWGEDVMATVDDKLHMSEQTSVQTVQGPVNFSKAGATHTFASPVNFSSTITTPNSNNLASLITAEVTQLLNINTATVSIGQWGYLGGMDQGVAQADNVIFNNTTVNNFYVKSGTTFPCHFDHAVTATRTWTFPDISGTVTMWNAANAAVTRYYSISGYEVRNAIDSAGNHVWTYDAANDWTESTVLSDTFVHVHLPHGAVVTALRVTSQEVGSTFDVRLWRDTMSSGAVVEMAKVEATASMEEVSDPSIDDATIDNDTYTYYLKLDISVAGTETRLRGIQIDYTITTPYS